MKATALTAATLFAALAFPVMTGAATPFDDTIRNAIHAQATPPATTFFATVTWLGTLGVLLPFAALAIAWLVRAGRLPEARLLGLTMAAAILVENALKITLRRPRPIPFFGTDPVTYSFPSGHTLFSLTFYGLLAILLTRRRAAPAVPIAALLLVATIGLSRIYLGVHYPSDVLGGYLVATAIIATALTLERKP